MRAARWFFIGIAAGLMAPAAMAFQETGGSGAQPGQSGPAATPKPSVNLEPRDPQKPATGAEIRIPGLGKIGVLPKLDFGLELLYGANEPSARPEDKRDPNADLQVRGVIKHKF